MKELISWLIMVILLSIAEVVNADPVIVDLIADQNMDVGHITITNDATNLYVTFAIIDDDPLAYPNWKMTETHLGIASSLAGIPQNKNGIPKVGAFTLGEDGESGTVHHDPPVTTYTYTIPLANLHKEMGGTLIIAAHAAIQSVEVVGEPDDIDPIEPDIIHKESAWASGEHFSDKNWAMYVEYEILRIFNDYCDNAEPVGDVTDKPFDTRGASFDGPGFCMNSPNIWYCYTASCTGTVTVSLLGSSYDTMLAVYNGCDRYPTPGDLVRCNDDFGGSYQSQVTFIATVGSEYLIEVGGYSSGAGEGLLSIDASCSVCHDFNGDGIINTQDLVDFTAGWLEVCPQTVGTSDYTCRDYNGDGVINTEDLIAFTAAWLENCPE